MQEVIPVLKHNAIKAYNEAKTPDVKEAIMNLVGKEHIYRDPKEWVKSVADLLQAKGPGAVWPDLIDMRERMIMSVFNMQEDGTEWKPNWADPSQRKWRIWVNTHRDDKNPLGFRLSFTVALYVDADASLGCRLYFKDQATAIHVGKYFLEELSTSIIY